MIDPITGAAIIGGGIELLGGLLGHSAQKKANKANIALARENMQWQERMSNTAYQRSTQDMLDAGLNPMLGFSQGGANTPSTSAARIEPEDALARTVSSAGAKGIQMAQLQNMQLQNQILVEKREQEHVTTMVMQNENPVGDQSGSKWKLQMDKLSADARKALAEASISEIENAIVRQTQGATVQSAKARAALLDQELNMNQLRSRLMELDIPEKEAMAEWFKTVGMASPAAKSVMSISQWIKFILGK